MSFHPILRIREQVRVLVQKIRRAMVLVLVLGGLFGALVVGKNIFLNEVRKEIRKTFAYDSLAASYFPPALVIENFRSLAGPPSFKARRIFVKVSFLSLLRNRRAISVRVEAPEIRIARGAPAAPRTKPRRPRSALSLPFIIEEGVINDGTVVLETKKGTLDLRGIQALITQKGEAFTVRATAENGRFASRPPVREYGGALSVILSGRGDQVKVDRLIVQGPDVQFRISGRAGNFRDPEVDLDLRFEVETAFLDAVLRMPFDHRGKVSGEGKVRRAGGKLSVETRFAGDDLAVSGVPLGRMRGEFGLAPGTSGRVELVMEKPGRVAENLKLDFFPGRVVGLAAPVYADPVFGDLDVPWPVKSPAWANFTLERRKLAVEAEFRDDSLEREGGRFALRGKADVNVDFAADTVSVRMPHFESSFGRLGAAADFDLHGPIDANIRGTVSDVKQAREFVSLVLSEDFGFGEIRGAGYVDARLTGRSSSPDVSLKATLSPGGFDRFDAAFVETEALISKGGFEGRFDVDDAEVKGAIRVKAAKGATEVDISNGEGELAKILPVLGVPVALAGRVAGDFRMVDTAGGQEFTGSFTSNEIAGYGQKAGRVSGRLAWKAGVLSFPELAMDFQGGRFDGRLVLGTLDGGFDVDMRGEELDFGQIVSGASGRLSLSAAGRGVFGKDRLSGLFTIKDMVLSPLRKTEARGEFGVDISGGRVILGLKGGLVPGENPFEGSFEFPLAGEPFSGAVKGSLGDLDLALPWKGAQGRMDYEAAVRDAEGGARISLSFGVAASLMPLPGFPYALTDFTAAAKYVDGALTLTSIGGKLGGGEVRGSGEVGLGGEGIATMDLRLEARDMLLSPMDRMRAQLDATLRMLKDGTRFVFEGDLLFKRLTWRREIYEGFGFTSRDRTAPNAGPSFFDGMSLNLRLRADENALIENSLGRFNGRFNLTVIGSLAAPVLLGDIDLSTGDLYFQDRSFRVITGRLSFVNPVSQEPLFDFRGETYVKDYRVTLVMSGLTSRLRPEFSSSPPLPPEDILSLLALGEAFKRTYYSYSGNRSSAMSTASLLTYQIADQAKKRTSGFFTLDRFRIDPYIPESTTGGIAARITVGKKISRDLLFVYSTSIANTSVRDEIDEYDVFRFEWDISRKFTLVGGRDDRGRLSIDVKFRRRF